MKHFIFTLLLTALMTSSLYAQTPKEILSQILAITQKDSITLEDYHRIVELTEKDPTGLEAFLNEMGFTYDVKIEILDAVYADVYSRYKDSKILDRRLELCEWAKNTYPADSQQMKLVNSNLVKIYADFRMYDEAYQQLKENYMACPEVSLDHAACVYTEGWLLNLMGRPTEALKLLEKAIEEYTSLLGGATRILADPSLPEDEIEFMMRGKAEAERGLDDSIVLAAEILGNKK